ncbi:hypothetical protein CCAL9344_05100 [Campylobacter sp. RM9344]|uniref:Uncharacterized protein n=1 Tax=Campylobacter californiensis TaxID=1032243 RepID=A0AAW3ZXN0_9BACT|nr:MULTISPECIES: hypothetical protein [unclassified Campylobacter]MBE2984990.1 hypothetical protein [Campylobacter sp. RM6883]MBE2986778.1 hypothetical protein [Campylobacter sp. RM12919]MBE2988428.1 hypothetical protein [Campylobacter sp. RM12920]MBE2995186.1 hypothetical protein [Campylobacter sp. RM6913]MBE3022126.1 hypothetical protein [Campylobacter sp. 7477a]MBE3029558.1 hypothetical protein [Campylobacter sp. RM9344]
MAFKFKLHFLSAFRQFLVYHHKSLEFRAKVFAAILSAKFEPDESDFEILRKIATEIYENDESRKAFLLQTTQEYISKVKRKDHLTLDALLLSIDKDMKKHRRYASKIDFAHLRRLMNGHEDEILIQQRVYEFLINEVKIYSQNNT